MNNYDIYDFIYGDQSYIYRPSPPPLPKVEKIYVNPFSKKYFHVILYKNKHLMWKDVGIDTCAACLQPGVCTNVKMGNLCFCEEYFQPHTIVHECFHAAIHLLRKYGFAKIDLTKYSNFEERVAVIQGYLFSQIIKKYENYLLPEIDPNGVWEANSKAYKF